MSHVPRISDIRVAAASLLDDVEVLVIQLAAEKHPAGREIALVKTKLQEARMWAGAALARFPTGFVPSDQPGKPETFSREI